MLQVLTCQSLFHSSENQNVGKLSPTSVISMLSSSAAAIFTLSISLRSIVPVAKLTYGRWWLFAHVFLNIIVMYFLFHQHQCKNQVISTNSTTSCTDMFSRDGFLYMQKQPRSCLVFNDPKIVFKIRSLHNRLVLFCFLRLLEDPVFVGLILLQSSELSFLNQFVKLPSF